MKRMLITVNGKRYEVEVEVLHDDDAGDAVAAFRPPPRAVDSYVTPPGPPPPAPPRSSAAVADPHTLTSPINGVVLEIPVQPGQEVRENEVLFVLEAMKMKTQISSPQSGRIRAIQVKVGDRIEAEQPLLTFE